MSEGRNVLFEIKLRGQDYTSILSCLKDCSINYSETFDELRAEMSDQFYFVDGKKNANKNGVCEKKFESQEKYKESIEKELIKNKILEIENELSKKREDVKNRLKEVKDRLKKLEKFKKAELSDYQEIYEVKEEKEYLEEMKARLDRFLANKVNKKSILFSDDKDDKGYKEVVSPSRKELVDLLEDEELVEILVTQFDGDTWKKAVDDRVNKHPLIMLYKKFAEDIELLEDENLIVGRRLEREIELKETDCKLYIYFKKSHMFGNLVGTVRKEYSCREFAEIYKNICQERGKVVDEQGKINIYTELKEDKYSDMIVVVTAQIRSRLDGASDKPFFLLEMLTQGNIIFSDNNMVPSNDADAAIFDCLLLFRLKKYLQDAYKKGVYRTYHTFHENDNRIKGSIDFAEHIRKNMGLDCGKVAYTYREKSVNNYLNHLIIEAYEELKFKYRDLVVRNFDNYYVTNDIINLLKRETKYPQYSRSEIMRKCETPISHPYYTEYETLRKVCLSVLRGEGTSIMTGEGDTVSGLLYYIPDLWEEYLESKMINLNMSSQEVIEVFNNGKEYKNKFRPDFVFETDDGRPYMILDAKYKPGWMAVHKSSAFGNHKSDYEECIRNMNAINAYTTGVIFPYLDEKEDNDYLKDNEEIVFDDSNVDNIRMHAISKYNHITSFYTIPIHVTPPGKDEFDKWKEKLDESINNKMIKINRIASVETEKFKEIDDLIRKIDFSEYKEEIAKNCTVHIS